MNTNNYCFIIDHEYQLSIVQNIKEHNHLLKDITIYRVKADFLTQLQYKTIELIQLFESKFSTQLKAKTNNQSFNFTLSLKEDKDTIYINLTNKNIEHRNIYEVTSLLMVIWKEIGKKIQIVISNNSTVRGSYLTANTSFFITTRINNYIAATFDLIHYHLSTIKND